VFFSHATEDKGRVLQVFGRLLERYPELDPWVDTFEIKAGQDLLDRIAEGMDESSRIFVFLSPVSIGKPWVQAEFKRALTQEISGMRPGLVVPVKMGGLEQVPAFMESKKYIDLDRLTEDEWVGEFYAAALGGELPRGVEAVPNLQPELILDPERPWFAQIAFKVVNWAEETAFKVRTAAPAVSVRGFWVEGGPVGASSFAELLTENEAGYASGHRLMPGRDFRMDIEFAAGVVAKDAIEDLNPWDGTGARISGMTFPTREG
jgi:hypothetical protein